MSKAERKCFLTKALKASTEQHREAFLILSSTREERLKFQFLKLPFKPKERVFAMIRCG